MSYGEDDWFQFTNEFNRPADSPGAAGNYNFEPGNIDNIPLSDDPPLSPGQGLDFDDFQYDQIRLSPNDGLNGQHQQPGTSGSNDIGGQFQNMHVMQNTDTFDQHMQPSTSMEYNSFEMPTVINSNMDAGPYQDLGIDDPNSYYANQQPSTSQGNDMITENYEMMGQPTSYIPQMEHVNPSSVGNPSSHSGMNQQNDNGAQVQQPPQPPKPKPKKRPPTKKKPVSSAPDTVGNVLSNVNKMQKSIENNNDNRMETRVSAEEAKIISNLMEKLQILNEQEANGADVAEEKAEVQTQFAKLFSVNVSQSVPDPSGNAIVSQINSLTVANGSASSSSQPTQQPKRPPTKKKPQNNRNVQPQQQNAVLPPQAQITPTKILPPTTTTVYNEGVNENYVAYQQMDVQGTSQHHYNDFQQPASQESMHHNQNKGHQQVIHAKVVPTTNQKTHNYRQAGFFPSQNANGPGPSPQLRPQSHESHHMDQMHDQHYQPQDHQRPQSRQMYTPVHHQHEEHIYQSQDSEPTLGDVVRKTQGRYQGPHDAPHLRQQLISNVNASTGKQIIQRSQAPTPSPGNFHNNSMHQQQYAEPFQHPGSYPASHDMQPNSHSQQGYDNHNQYEAMDEFCDVNTTQTQESQVVHMQTDPQQQQYEQPEMYMPINEQEELIEPDVYYPEIPTRTPRETKEKLLEKLEERRLVRVERVKNVIVEQHNRLNEPIDLTPFRGKMDILERMLPFHQLSSGEEPVSNFDSTFEKVMSNTLSQANFLGSRIRNIVLRDTMRSSTEWEENMILFLETESERRKLEQDRQLAEQDLRSFLQNSDIIHNVRNHKLNLERTRRAVPMIPNHLKDLEAGQLSAMYKEYEFDSYDENRPRGSPLAFVYEEPESESESEPESEKEEDSSIEVQPTRSDISPLVGFPQHSPSPSRDRNESESTFDWKDLDESPLLSPETTDTEKYSRAAEQHSDIFGTQEDLDKSEPFPFKEISEAARKQQELLQQARNAESVRSSVESSSSEASTLRQTKQPKTRSSSPEAPSSSRVVEMRKSSPVHVPSSISCEIPSTSASTSIFIPSRREDEGSPEIDEDYSMTPPPLHRELPRRSQKTVSVEDIAPIPLPVPIDKIKLEKDDSIPKLRLRVPVSVLKKGIEMAANEDDDDIQEIPVVKREPLKLKFNLKSVKIEEQSPDQISSRQSSRTVTPVTGPSADAVKTSPVAGAIPPKTVAKTSAKSPESLMKSPTNVLKATDSSKSPIFKTPIQTPLKNTLQDARKRRSEKIEDSSQKKKFKDGLTPSSFITPKNKNGYIENQFPPIGRFLKTMTDGRKIIMKIGKIPRNINHFVTPRRDSKGNLHKNLSPTKDTRLKMRFYKKNGELAVEVTEKIPDEIKEEKESFHVDPPVSNGPSTSYSAPNPTMTASVSAKGRPASASRKSSIDTAPKDKKNSVAKNKSAFSNRFNPFATVPSSSKPSTSNAPSAVPGPSTLAPVSLKVVPPPKPLPSVSRIPSLMPIGLPTSATSAQQIIEQRTPMLNLLRTTPIIPKITVTAAAVPEKTKEDKEMNNKNASLLPWMFEKNNSFEQKQTPIKSQSAAALVASSSTPIVKDHLKVQTEPSEEAAVSTQQESPRASSSLSISFFEDDKANGFPFLHSPKQAKEPLPVVEFSDDDEDDIAHKTFSHATELLIRNSKNNLVNGSAPILPWSTEN